MRIFNAYERKFGAVTSESSRIDYIDGWRGIAIIFVLLSHFIDIDVINLGRLGVDIFFALSGMLMAKILFIDKMPLNIFYKRRFSRIFPVFFTYLTLVSLFSWMFSLSKEHTNYFYNIFFIRAYFPESPDLWNTGLPIGHLWSLNVEEHCYLILSLVTLLKFWQRKFFYIIASLGFCSIIIQYLYQSFPDKAPSAYYLRTEVVASFIMISAAYSLVKNKFEKFIPSWLPLFTFLLSVICYSYYTPHWDAKWTLSPFLLAFTVNHLNLIPTFFINLLSLKSLRFIGIWSFSIYLWQQPFYQYHIMSEEFFKYQGILFLIISIISGAISFYLIENPARKYLNNIFT